MLLVTYATCVTLISVTRAYIEVLIQSEIRNLSEHSRTMNTVEIWPATEM
jgi:hypothetical protein